MTGVYSSRFAEYSAPSFHVTAQLVKNETTTVVGSEITRVTTGEEIDLDWIVAKTPDSYKVVDITAGGMSLSRAQREEFSSVVHRNGDSIPNLIRQLQAKSSELAASEP
jgi:ABC-type transporter MlaC component